MDGLKAIAVRIPHKSGSMNEAAPGVDARRVSSSASV